MRQIRLSAFKLTDACWHEAFREGKARHLEDYATVRTRLYLAANGVTERVRDLFGHTIYSSPSQLNFEVLF